MKIRTIMAAAATGILLTAAGSSLAWGADWTCPRGYADCTDYEYCRSHEHGDCEGHWSEDGDWVCLDGNHGRTSSSDPSGYGCHSGNSHHGRRGCGSHHR